MAELENAALNGDLFRPHRSPSPARSISSFQANTDDELGSDLSRPSSPSRLASSHQLNVPGPVVGAQTGPKGVMNDRQHHARQSAMASCLQKQAIIADQEKHAIVGSTSTEEDVLRERERLLRENEEDGLAREKWRASRKAELIRGENNEEDGKEGGSRRGGLREIGKEGFVSAVERSGWTVILIYEPNMPRCHSIMASTLSLSLSLPASSSLTILRARATSLEFSLLPKEDPSDPDEEPRADEDVLPTLLAYRNGELEKTWIRVDWETGDDGIEGLLKREGILKAPGLTVDDGDDD